MKLLNNLYQVGGSLMGLSHTELYDPFDECNSYLLDLGESHILFDCGNGETLEQIFSNIKYWGLSPDKISHCFLTHSHWDHAGAAFLLNEMGIKLFAHPVTAKSIAAGDERCCGYLYHKKFTPCTVDKTLEDAESVTINNTTIIAHHLPGHTMGCTAYKVNWNGKILMFSGDVIGTIGFGDFGWDGSIDFNKKVYIESLIKFVGMDFDIMLGGHGLVSFAEPKRRVEASLNQALIQWR